MARHNAVDCFIDTLINYQMAFNFQTFRTRALTAILFVWVMGAGLLWNQWSFLALFSVIHFGCWIEYQQLTRLIDKEDKPVNWFYRVVVMLTGWGFLLWMTDNRFRISNIILHNAGFFLFLAGMIVLGSRTLFLMLNKKSNLRFYAHSLAGFLYISLSWGLMMKLWGNLHQTVFTGYNWIMPVLLIASIWINDTMAYIVGSFIGKTPLSAISPKKTWEGTIGGALLAILAVTLTGVYAFHFPVMPLVLISVTAAIAGTAGDLLESKLKRMAGVKDSGNIMPGHGGFLDRFDSLLVATTVVWIIFRLFY